MTGHSPAPPLAGLRVIDMGSMISVPYAAMLLAEMGADVIKVEPPRGDESRHSMPQVNEMAAYFYNLNRGKRSATFDLKSDDDLRAVLQLIAGADVVMENWRPGVAQRLGVDFGELRVQHPRLITVSIRGYGEVGPYAHDRVYDPIVQGVSSMACGQGGADTPALVRTYLPDKLASLAALEGVLTALYQRERTGLGTHVALSMLDAAVSFLWPDGMLYHTLADAPVEAELMKRPGPRVAHMVATGEGEWFVCTAVTDSQWAGLCKALGVADLAQRYPTGLDRKRHNAEINRQLTQACHQLSRSDILDRLRSADVPCGPVNTVEQMLVDPQVTASGTVRIDKIEGLGLVRHPAPMVQVGAFAAPSLTRAPFLGEHTAEILADLDRAEAFRSAEVSEEAHHNT